MSERDSGSTHFEPKHRIIGAVVVVVIGVIILSLLLKDRAPTPEPSAQGLTPRWAKAEGEENRVAVTIVTPPVRSSASPKADPAPTPSPPAISAPVVGAPAATPPPAPAPEATRAPTPAPTPATKATSAPKPPASANKPITNGWIVQVGTFSSTTNAARVQDKLRSMGQAVQAEQVSVQGNKAVRVRVGPFRDRAGAVKAQERIQKETGMKVVVLAYP